MLNTEIKMFDSCIYYSVPSLLLWISLYLFFLFCSLNSGSHSKIYPCSLEDLITLIIFFFFFFHDQTKILWIASLYCLSLFIPKVDQIEDYLHWENWFATWKERNFQLSILFLSLILPLKVQFYSLSFEQSIFRLWS